MPELLLLGLAQIKVRVRLSLSSLPGLGFFWKLCRLIPLCPTLTCPEFAFQGRHTTVSKCRRAYVLFSCLRVCVARAPPGRFRDEALAQVLPGFLEGSRPHSFPVLRKLWALNQEAMLQGMMALHRKDPAFVSRALDICQELKVCRLVPTQSFFTSLIYNVLCTVRVQFTVCTVLCIPQSHRLPHRQQRAVLFVMKRLSHDKPLFLVCVRRVRRATGAPRGSCHDGTPLLPGPGRAGGAEGPPPPRQLAAGARLGGGRASPRPAWPSCCDKTAPGTPEANRPEGGGLTPQTLATFFKALLLFLRSGQLGPTSQELAMEWQSVYEGALKSTPSLGPAACAAGAAPGCTGTHPRALLSRCALSGRWGPRGLPEGPPGWAMAWGWG